jgi:NADH:ubiquinone oxidoreductase subunit 4 (subunit M)
MSIYTVMLLVSMLFMAIAVIAMYMELNRWAPDYYRTNTAQPSVMVQPIADMNHYG